MEMKKLDSLLNNLTLYRLKDIPSSALGNSPLRVFRDDHTLTGTYILLEEEVLRIKSYLYLHELNNSNKKQK